MRAVNKAEYFETIRYTPHPLQWVYHNSDARFRVAVCGRRFGKSTMAGKDIQPELFLPDKRFWIVGPTYDLGEKEFRVIWDDLIVAQQLGTDKRVRKAYNKRSGDMYIEFPWKTRIEVRSADHPENLVGERLDGVIVSEAAKHRVDTWERYLRPALADNRGWADFPTTPEGQNWLYKMWQLGQNPDIPEYASWRFPSWDNPAVYPGGEDDPEIELLKKTTIYEWFLQEIAADFTSFVGKIYPEFDETIHVRKTQYNPEWKNYIAFDWGFVNPLAAIEFQVDPQDNIHIWREHYVAYKTLEEHLKIMQGREQPPDYRIECTFGDAADPEAVAVVCQKFAACVAMPEAKTNWRQGVELVKTFLQMREIGKADEFGTPLEAPKLFVDHSCPNIIREFNNYRAGKRPDQPTSATTPNNVSMKVDDHALDALRYGLMHVFELGAKHHLSETVSMADIRTDAQPFFTTGKTF